MKKVGIGASWNRPNNRPASRITTGTPRSICTSSTTAKTTATAMRIQNVAGNRSRWSSARFRHTSVITLVTDMAAASSSPMGAKPGGSAPPTHFATSVTGPNMPAGSERTLCMSCAWNFSPYLAVSSL
jgi:hypothetical protein